MGTATGSDPDAASTEDPARAERARALATRRAHILGDTDLGTGRFLEIGPLAAPNVTPEMADVRYADVVDREGLVAHYGGDPSVDVDLIPEIDFWLTRDDGTVGTLAEAVATAAPFHHVVACHVIEHVPDLVGWLRDVADVLVDGGHLLLAVPDLRFSYRRTTTAIAPPPARRSTTTRGPPWPSMPQTPGPACGRRRGGSTRWPGCCRSSSVSGPGSTSTATCGR
jgi:hypothetical protein